MASQFTLSTSDVLGSTGKFNFKYFDPNIKSVKYLNFGDYKLSKVPKFQFLALLAEIAILNNFVSLKFYFGKTLTFKSAHIWTLVVLGSKNYQNPNFWHFWKTKIAVSTNIFVKIAP